MRWHLLIFCFTSTFLSATLSFAVKFLLTHNFTWHFAIYNGTSPMADTVTYKLSDMFAHKTENPAIELSVTAYNINEGHNQSLLDACKSLKGYSIFVAKVRKYRQEAEDNYNKENPVPLKNLVDKDEILEGLISSAVSKAIDECIQENVLKDFFLTYRQEVIDMSYSECTAEEQLEIIANDRYETGFNNGSKETAKVFSWLLSSKRYDDAQKASSDPVFLKQLMTEYDSCHEVK